MKISSIENSYVSCASNSYPNCVDNFEHLVLFGTHKSLSIYDLKQNRIVLIVSEHSKPVNSVRWIGYDGRFCISSSIDRTSIIYEHNCDEYNRSLEARYILKGHQDSVIVSDSIRSSDQSGKFFTVSSSNDKNLRLWLNDQEICSYFFQYFIFDIKIIDDSIIPGTIVMTAGSNQLVLINRFDFETKNFESLATLKGHHDWIKSIDFVCQKNQILLASAAQDNFIRVYEIKKSSDRDEDQRFVISTESEKTFFIATLDTVLESHKGWVTHIKWINYDSKLHLLSCSMDMTIILWEQLDQQENYIWNEKSRFGEVGSYSTNFLHCSYIESMNLILGQSINGAIHFWSQNDKKHWIPNHSITGHFNEVTDLAWNSDGDYFLTCSSDQTTRLHSQWSDPKYHTWHEMNRPQTHGYDINSIATAGVSRFVSGADEKVIRIFDITKTSLNILQKISTILTDIDAESVDIAESAIVQPLSLTAAKIDHSDLLKSSRIYDMPPNEEFLLHNTLWFESQKLYGHGYEIFCVEVNHSATILASACKASNPKYASIIFWDLKTFKLLVEIESHQLTVTRIRFSPDDHFALSVSRDRTWTIIRVSDFQIIASCDKSTGIHSRIIWDCCWTPDSSNFITASRDKCVITWSFNADKKTEISAMKNIAFKEPITTVDVHEKLILKNHCICALGFENGTFSLHSISLENHEWSLLYSFDKFRSAHRKSEPVTILSENREPRKSPAIYTPFDV
ncbi:hypothetical protein SSS_04609 [Sarcoptes scabiei]|uniref:Elongator complex protein 2 n=1 Tax=Sarcoptes scabiei TaxID=52283 RepID=A0A834VBQ7_SARSC|nr:hypothetical protein SSS_04609 [Sarcoptes scabiei]